MLYLVCYLKNINIISIVILLVLALTLYHLNGGCRWLLTASFDRDVCIWDLQNYSYPVHSSRKNIVTDGVWLTNWLCNLVSSDEGSTGCVLRI